MKKAIAILCFLFAAFGIIFLILYPSFKKDKSQPAINSFEECAAAGYPVMESYPRQCSTPSGQNFVEILIPEK